MCQKILVSHAYNNNPSNIEKKSIGPSKNTDEKKKKSDQKKERTTAMLFVLHTNTKKKISWKQNMMLLKDY